MRRLAEGFVTKDHDGDHLRSWDGTPTARAGEGDAVETHLSLARSYHHALVPRALPKPYNRNLRSKRVAPK